jgi:hypothetical protein
MMTEVVDNYFALPHFTAAKYRPEFAGPDPQSRSCSGFFVPIIPTGTPGQTLSGHFILSNHA